MDQILADIVDQPIKADNNCETFTLQFANSGMHSGSRFPDISAQKHCELLFKQGSSDTEYEKYKRENKMVDITDFNADGISELYLVLEDGFRQRRIVFKAVYDSNFK